MFFISDVAIEIRQRQFHRFNRQMKRLHGIRMMFFNSTLLQNTERNQRGDALPVWRQLLHRTTGKITRQQFYPVHTMIGQILCRQVRAMLFRESGNFLRQLAAVKRFTVGSGNQLQRMSLRRVTEDPPTRGARPSGAKQALKHG